MGNVSDLVEADKVNSALTAYRSYQAAVNQDELSQVADEAKLPNALVFFNTSTGAVIIILPERHESKDVEVQGEAAIVAKRVLAIPKVKIAVEEPILYNDTLLSNVGWGKDVTGKLKDQSLFDFEATSQGSISHQIYERQVGDKEISTSRYAAEKMPRDPERYGNKKINKTMAEKLIANTSKDGEISVFPVGPDHLSTAYDTDTLGKHLKNAGWKLLA